MKGLLIYGHAKQRSTIVQSLLLCVCQLRVRGKSNIERVKTKEKSHQRGKRYAQRTTAKQPWKPQPFLASVHCARICVDETILSHQRTFSAILQVDVVSVEVSLGGDDHHLRERAAGRGKTSHSAMSKGQW